MTFGNSPGRKLAPRNTEYGTISIGFVGNARNGCCVEDADGEGGVLHGTVSTGDVEVEPDVQLDVVFELIVGGFTDTDDFDICLELQ